MNMEFGLSAHRVHRRFAHGTRGANERVSLGLALCVSDSSAGPACWKHRVCGYVVRSACVPRFTVLLQVRRRNDRAASIQSLHNDCKGRSSVRRALVWAMQIPCAGR